MVRAHSGPPQKNNRRKPEEDIVGDIAQLGERLPCKQEVAGSIPTISTNLRSNRSIRGIECFDLTSKEVGSRTLKTEQCDMYKSKATERLLRQKTRQANFNCGTTSERMKGNDYNFNLCEACIILKRTNFSDWSRKRRQVKLKRAQGECLGIRSRRRTR